LTIAPGRTVTGTLAGTSGRSGTCSGCFADIYAMTLGSSQSLAITVTSPAFNTQVRVLDGSGNAVASATGAINQNARTVNTLAAGSYSIEVSSTTAGIGGAYTLSVVLANTAVVLPIQLGQSVSGILSSSSFRSVGCSGCYADLYQLALGDNTPLTITMTSLAFTPALRVLARDGSQLAGGSSNSMVTLTLAAGTYEIEAAATQTGTGGGYTLSVVRQTGKPDLVPSTFTAPTGATVAKTFQISVGIKNVGSNAAGSFRVGFYFSNSATAGLTSVFSGWNCALDHGLPAGSASVCSGAISAPQSLAPGVYYLGAIVDDLGQVDEADESNNVRTADTGPITLTAVGQSAARADLVLTNITFPSNVTPGGQVALSAAIGNQGSADAGPFRVGFSFSLDSTISQNDVPAGSCNVSSLAAGAATTCSTTATVSTSLAPGVYYGGAIADDAGQVDESNETNNSRLADSGPVRVAATSQAARPDLIVTSVTMPASGVPGAQAAFSATVGNQGSGAAGPFRMSFYLSADSVVATADTNIGACTFTLLAAGDSATGLQAGASTTCSGPVAIPSWLSPGTYYGGAIADDQNQVDESDENNNTLMASGTIVLAIVQKPDPIVTSVTFPSSGTIGAQATFAATVKNQGNAAAGAFRLGFYLSTSSNVTTGSINPGYCTFTSLAAGASTSCSGPITIPSISAGTYYGAGIVDDQNQVDESNENNNTLAASNTVTIKH
jgi:subtilase family serine protease